MWIRETFVNETKGHQFGESEWYEAAEEKTGDLFRSLRKEYGACSGFMYRESKDSGDIRVGWVFRKRQEYDDARGLRGPKDLYLRSVWVEVSTVEPKRALVTTQPPVSPWLKAA